jgi:hypothetical protein
MSQGTPIHALNNQTNINGNRYFFATQEAGEQELFVSTLSGGGSLGNISSLAVGISGPAGNAVVVSEAPTFIASEFVSADQGMATGLLNYWTLSTLSTSLGGVSISSDRSPGSGIACIESYGTNGSTGGFEFLSRGVNGIVVSSINTQFNQWVSSIGRPGATMVMGASGTVLAGNEFEAPFFTSLNPQAGGSGRPCFGIQDLSGAGGLTPQARWAIGTTGIAAGANVGSDFALFSYDNSGNFITAPMAVKRSDGAMNIANLSSVNAVPYAANMFSTNVSFGMAGLASNSPLAVYRLSNAVTSNIIPNRTYLVDFPLSVKSDPPGGSGAWIELALSLGGSSNFNYGNTIYIPPTGLPPQGVNAGLVQVVDAGAADKELRVIGYMQGVSSISSVMMGSFVLGGETCYFKELT